MIKPASATEHGRVYTFLARGFAAIDRAYARSLDAAIHWKRETMAVFLATIALTGVLFVYIRRHPKPSRSIYCRCACRPASDKQPDQRRGTRGQGSPYG